MSKKRSKEEVKKSTNKTSLNINEKSIPSSADIKAKETSKDIYTKPIEIDTRIKSKNNNLKRIILLLICTLILVFFIYLTFNFQKSYPFTISISDSDSIIFNEIVRYDNPTSPLCGCLNDSIPHNGAMLASSYCLVKHHSPTKLSNLLLTCPDESDVSQNQGFSYDMETFSFSGTKFQNMEINELYEIRNDSTIRIQKRTFNDNSFNSIICNENIEVYSPDDKAIFAFIGATRSQTKVLRKYNKYRGIIDKVEVRNYYDFGGNEEYSITNVSALDCQGENIVIKWQDTFQVLTPLGEIGEDLYNDDSTLNIVPPLGTVNIAVIRPKNNLRISFLAWNEKIDYQWRSDFFSQIGSIDDEYIVYKGIPFMNTRTGEFVDITKTPYKIPNLLYTGSNSVNLEFRQLIDINNYKDLYDAYSQNEGYWYNFDSSDFFIGRGGEIKDAIKDTNVIIEFEKENTKRTDADWLLNRSKRFFNAIDESKIVPTDFNSISLKGRREYFRYPPIHKELGVSIYSKFSSIKFGGCKGLLIFNNRKYQLDNQEIELSELNNVDYGYPSLFINLDKNNKTIQLKGIAKINLDGEAMNEYWYESRYVNILGVIASLLGFIALCWQIFGIRIRSRIN